MSVKLRLNNFKIIGSLLVVTPANTYVNLLIPANTYVNLLIPSITYFRTHSNIACTERSYLTALEGNT